MANATIRDVAQQARVSIKTVSRVINNVSTVKPNTREKVMRVIRKLDYHPNPSARGLGASRSYLIGLLYDVSCGYYATTVLAGILEVCRAARYQVVMQPCNYLSATVEGDVLRNVLQSGADGIVITPPMSDMAKIIAMFDEKDIPFVRITPADRRDVERSVYTNDRKSCSAMTEQLCALGHKRIGFIVGNPDHAAVLDRYRGYADGLQRCGLKLDKGLVVQGFNSFESGVQCARQLLLSTDNRPTAIFASNDEMAAGVMAVAHGMGLAVPEDLSVVGFDDMPLASQIWPALSTIKQPIVEMSAMAAAMLVKQLRGEPNDGKELAIDATLVFRQSTGPSRDRAYTQRARSRAQNEVADA